MKLDFITSNKHKFEEISAYLNERHIDCNWIEETYEEIQGETTEEISRDSAVKLSMKRKDPFFMEDTGLYIHALKGFPGPYSSFVAKTIGNRGILDLLHNRERGATFLTVISYWDGKHILSFKGSIDGEIALEARGNNGFGYDPVFIPSGSQITLAEMDMNTKNRFSHRINALENFLNNIL